MIILIYGADSFRSKRFLQELKNKFINDVDPGSQSLDSIDGTSSNLQEIKDKLETGSLFVKKRFLIVDKIFSNKKEKLFDELEAYLGTLSANQDNILVFYEEDINSKARPLKAKEKKLFNFLKNQPYSQEFLTLGPKALAIFIQKEAASLGKAISASGAERLAKANDNDLWLINGELRKLAFASQEKTISDNSIEASFSFKAADNIFALMDAIGKKDKKSGKRLLIEQYLAGASDEYLISMFGRQFRLLLQAKAAADNGQSADILVKELKLHPFAAKKAWEQSRNFSTEELKNLEKKLIKIDAANKTGQGEAKTRFLLLISEL